MTEGKGSTTNQFALDLIAGTRVIQATAEKGGAPTDTNGKKPCDTVNNDDNCAALFNDGGCCATVKVITQTASDAAVADAKKNRGCKLLQFYKSKWHLQDASHGCRGQGYPANCRSYRYDCPLRHRPRRVPDEGRRRL